VADAFAKQGLTISSEAQCFFTSFSRHDFWPT